MPSEIAQKFPYIIECNINHQIDGTEYWKDGERYFFHKWIGPFTSDREHPDRPKQVQGRDQKLYHVCSKVGMISMKHDEYLDDGRDHDTSMVMEIELDWNQLVEAFWMNEFPVVGID